MKRPADVAFGLNEPTTSSSAGLPHSGTSIIASPDPNSRPQHTRSTSRKTSKGSTTLRRGPTFLDHAELAKAAAAAQAILSRSSSSSYTNNMDVIKIYSPYSDQMQSATSSFVVPPAVTKAKQRSNVIRRAKTFVQLDQPHEESAPTPRPTKRQKTSASNDSEFNQNVSIPLALPESPPTGQPANPPSFSQSLLAASYRLVSSIGLGGWISPPLGLTSPPPSQIEKPADLPHLAQIDEDVEMHDAEVKMAEINKNIMAAPQILPRAPPVVMPTPIPSMITVRPPTSIPPYTPAQWKRLSRFPHLVANRSAELAIRKRHIRKKWDDNGRLPSDNAMCHLARPMTRSPLSSEIFPEEEEGSSSGRLTSHSSMTSIASTASFEDIPSVPGSTPTTVQDDRVIPMSPSSACMYTEKFILYGEFTTPRTRYRFYPLFTKKKPGKENRDVLRKTTLLTNFGYWLYQTELWMPAARGGLNAVVQWFDRFPELELPTSTSSRGMPMVCA